MGTAGGQSEIGKHSQPDPQNEFLPCTGPSWRWLPTRHSLPSLFIVMRRCQPRAHMLVLCEACGSIYPSTLAAVDSSVFLKVVAQSSPRVRSTRTRGTATVYTPSPSLSTSPAVRLGPSVRHNSKRDVTGGVAGSGAVVLWYTRDSAASDDHARTCRVGSS